MHDPTDNHRHHTRMERALRYCVGHWSAFLVASTAIFILGLASTVGLTINDDVLDFLPQDDPVVHSCTQLADSFHVMDHMYFAVTIRDDDELTTEHGQAGAGHSTDATKSNQSHADDFESGSVNIHDVSTGTLIAHADDLHDRLVASGLFEHIMYRWTPNDVASAVETVRRVRASLFTDKDAMRLTEKLTPQVIHDSMEQWRRILTESPAPFAAQHFYDDPLHINEIFVDKIRSLQTPGARVVIHQGRLLSPDLKHVLIIAQPGFPATDSARSQELIDKLDREIAAQRRDGGRLLKVAYFGGHRASLDNARRIKADIQLTVTLSIVAIAMLSFLVYSRPRLLLFTFLPVVFGGTVALGIMRWVDPFISAVSIGCGAMLIGISVDYAVHVLYGVDRCGSEINARKGIVGLVRRLLAPIVLSGCTTLSAFGVLHFSIIPGYRNLGHFGALGIAGAALFSIVVLPPLVVRLRGRSTRRPIWRLVSVFPPLFHLAAKRRGVWLIVPVLLSIVALAGLCRVELEGDIRKLSAISPEASKDLDSILGTFGDVMSSTVMAVSAGNPEEALRKNQILASTLRRQQEAGRITSISTVADLLPGPDVQRENRARWKSLLSPQRLETLSEDLTKACTELGIKVEVLGGFLQSLPGSAPLIDYRDYSQGILGEMTAHHLSETNGRLTVLTELKLTDPDDFGAILADVREVLPNVIAYDGRFFVRHMVKLIYGEMKRLGVLTFGVILVLLLIFVRRPGLVAAMMLPLLASLLWTFGLLGLLGIHLNMINGVVVVFIFGLIVDYGIFLSLALRREDDPDHEHLMRTCGAITISALTTLCGLGALLFANHPALSSIGVTALVGISSGLLAVLTIVPLMGKAPQLAD